MPFPRALTCVLALAVIAVIGTGCKPKPPKTTPEGDQPATATPAREVPPPSTTPPAPRKTEVTDPFPSGQVEVERMPIEASVEELNRKGVLQTIYFEFDQYDLSDSARLTLQANADWLRRNRDYSVVVEGHCDERGTIEYNLSLGERRARAVRGYLVQLGLSSDRLRIISFGEERPEDPGHQESAWSRNRRAAFVIEQ